MRRTGLTRLSTRMRQGRPLRAHRAKPGRTGRMALDREQWALMRLALFERAGGRCELSSCRKRCPLEPHHVIKRSRGGPDAMWNLVALCRAHHEACDRPYRDGRLVFYWTLFAQPRTSITPVIEMRANKWAPVGSTLLLDTIRVA